MRHSHLSLLDTSDADAQPMISQSGSYHIVINGEIYNFATLLEALPSQVEQKLRSTSDSETFAEYIDSFGVSMALTKANGMFAFALRDSEMQCLYLARDRMSKKPLYYRPSHKGLSFSSEIKALLKHP